MPLAERAAQFAPFAALEGHAAAVSSTAQRVRLQVEEREKQQAITLQTQLSELQSQQAELQFRDE